MEPTTFLPALRTYSSGNHTPEPPIVLDLSARRQHKSPVSPYDFRYAHTNVEPCTSPLSVSGQSESSDVSSTEIRDVNANYDSFKCKQNRPFKAYLKDPLSMTIGSIADDILKKDSSEAYNEFRRKLMSHVQSSNNAVNKNMRRTQSQNANVSDPSYWEKRKKNNEAAKRSRDARRAKEDEIAIRCAFLEQENIQLKFRLSDLESERQRLQKLLYP